MEKQLTFCIMGAGNGGLAMAAHIVLRGHRVNLFNRSAFRLAGPRAIGGVQVEGEVEGFAPIEVITNNSEEAIRDADVLMVTVPANGHRFMAEKSAPHLKDGQIILLNPGRTGGALEFRNVLRAAGCKADVIVAEAQTFLYASRLGSPGQVKIFRIKKSNPIAALPAKDTKRALSVIRQAFPEFVGAPDVMHTSLDNIGAVFHPTLTVLNAARIENTRGAFQYYIDGNSPSVSRILEGLDAERLAVAEACGTEAISARDWLELAYDASGSNLYEAMQNNEGYYGITAPTTLRTRYISEDVPMSLVPIASIGDQYGVPVPTFHAFIHLASLLHQTDYLAQGRTVETLGIAGMTPTQLRRYVQEGA